MSSPNLPQLTAPPSAKQPRRIRVGQTANVQLKLSAWPRSPATKILRLTTTRITKCTEVNRTQKLIRKRLSAHSERNPIARCRSLIKEFWFTVYLTCSIHSLSLNPSKDKQSFGAPTLKSITTSSMTCSTSHPRDCRSHFRLQKLETRSSTCATTLKSSPSRSCSALTSLNWVRKTEVTLRQQWTTNLHAPILFSVWALMWLTWFLRGIAEWLRPFLLLWI